MIRIYRPETVPRILEQKGKDRTAKDCADYDADPEAHHSGKKKFSIVKSIYGTQAIKRKLLEMQHKKCCYCETKFLASGHGAVEHFRPKGSVRQDRNSIVEKPGYYWLGYTWSNLLVSCSQCNTSHKNVLFPLHNPGRRARNHNDTIADEEPMLVDPGAEEPRDHIRFRFDAPVALTPRGEETKCVLGLERPDLAESRLKVAIQIGIAERLRKMYEAMNALEHRELNEDQQLCMDRVDMFLARSVEPTSEYSSMAIDLLDFLRSR